MNVTLTTHPKEDYLLIESNGSIETMEELLAHSQMVWEEINNHEFRNVLIDEIETMLPLELTLYFNLVKSYVDSFPPEIYDVKIAIVVAEAYFEVASSWETLCQSRGLQYFAFTSLEAATHCLTSKDDE